MLRSLLIGIGGAKKIEGMKGSVADLCQPLSLHLPGSILSKITQGKNDGNFFNKNGFMYKWRLT